MRTLILLGMLLVASCGGKTASKETPKKPIDTPSVTPLSAPFTGIARFTNAAIGIDYAAGGTAVTLDFGNNVKWSFGGEPTMGTKLLCNPYLSILVDPAEKKGALRFYSGDKIPFVLEGPAPITVSTPSGMWVLTSNAGVSSIQLLLLGDILFIRGFGDRCQFYSGTLVNRKISAGALPQLADDYYWLKGEFTSDFTAAVGTISNDTWEGITTTSYLIRRQ